MFSSAGGRSNDKLKSIVANFSKVTEIADFGRNL